MSYEKHNKNQCDKCCEKFKKNELYEVPFLYMDKNDKSHPDQTKIFHEKKECELKKRRPDLDESVIKKIIPMMYEMDWGYRQYNVCEKCLNNMGYEV